jgi:hypothetical protein
MPDALHFAQWQTVIVLRATAVTSVEAQIGQTLQVAGMVGVLMAPQGGNSGRSRAHAHDAS